MGTGTHISLLLAKGSGDITEGAQGVPDCWFPACKVAEVEDDGAIDWFGTKVFIIILRPTQPGGCCYSTS
jgi:hypothetical protein